MGTWHTPWLLPGLVCLVAGAFTSVAPAQSNVRPQVLTLKDLTDRGLARNPSLNQAQLEVDAALGRADQAGRYPNPTVTVSGEEIGKNAGIHTLPLISQELVTGNKLGLSRAAALRQVDQATWGVVRQRLIFLSSVRQAYYDVLTVAQRRRILADQVKVAEQSLERIKAFKGQEQIVLVEPTAQLELTRLRAELATTENDGLVARRRLSVIIGEPDILPAATIMPLDPLEELRQLPYGLPSDDAKKHEEIFIHKKALLSQHPEIQMAHAALARAELVVQREVAERRPNLTVGAGFQKNFNDREHQAMYQVSMPLPVFNRNQGAIRAAQADLGKASFEVTRVENDLTTRLASAWAQYVSAYQRATSFSALLPKLEKTPQQVENLFKAGELKDSFSFLSALQAQKTVADARLEHLRALAEAWRAASELSGLLMEEDWPLVGR